jgi:hypothetical protein
MMSWLSRPYAPGTLILVDGVPSTTPRTDPEHPFSASAEIKLLGEKETPRPVWPGGVLVVTICPRGESVMVHVSSVLDPARQ